VHVPDGFVSPAINVATAAVSSGAIGIGLARARRAAAETSHMVPLLATTAAFVFAAQMLNFPIGGGTSGHFLGAAAAAALLGPWNACLVMTVVLVIQGLFFGDGGITALGTNIFNMGIVAGLGGFILMRPIRSLLPDGRGPWLASAAVAGWAGVVAASAACSLELAASGTAPLAVALPAMVGTHAVIGAGEALITAAVLAAVAASRPDILPAWARVEPRARTRGHARRKVAVLASSGLLLAATLALLAGPFASRRPDGLEKVAEETGFLGRAEALWRGAPFQDYSLGAVGGGAGSTGLAGLLGTAAVFTAGYFGIRLFQGRAGTDRAPR